MSDKVKPWHQRKPKRHDGPSKNLRPKAKHKNAPCPVDPNDFGDDIDGDDGSMLGGEWADEWKT